MRRPSADRRCGTIEARRMTIVGASALAFSLGIIVAWLSFTARQRSGASKSEARLQKERATTRLILDASSAFFVMIDADGRAIRMNEALREALEIAEDEIAGLDFIASFVPEEDRESTAGVFRRIAEKGESTLSENHLISRSGRTRLVEWRGRPIFREDGELDYFIGVGVDITERARTMESLAENLNKYKTLSETASMGIWHIGDSSRTAYINPAMRELLQLDADDSLDGIGFERFFTPESIATIAAENGTRLAGKASSYEVTIVGKKGRRRDVILSGAPLLDGHGRLIGRIATFADITERKEAEEILARREMALRESEERFRGMIEQSPFSIMVFAPDGALVEVNEANARLWGVSRDVALLYNVMRDGQLESAGLMGEVERAFEGNLVSLPAIEYDLSTTLGRGGKKIVLGEFYPLRAADGTIRNIVLVHQDVTEKVLAERGLKESEERFMKAFRANPGPTVMSDIETATMFDVNDRWLEMLGYEREEMIGRTSYELGLWADPARRGELAAIIDRDGSFRDEPIRLITKSGDYRDTLWSGERILIRGRSVMLSLFIDITERNRALAETADREKSLRTIIDAAPYAIAISRASDGTYLDVNKALLDKIGLSRDAVIGKTATQVFTLVHPEDDRLMKEELHRDGKIDSFEYSIDMGERGITRQLVSLRPLQYRGERCFVAATIDITRLKLVEEQLLALNADLERKVIDRTQDLAEANLELQAANAGLARAMGELKETQDKMLLSEKLASLGRLAAGIAHELNTPLAAIAASNRVELRHLGPGLDRVALAVSSLGPEAARLLREASARLAGLGAVVTADPGIERTARKDVASAFSAAGVPDAESIADEFAELGLGELAAGSIPTLKGPEAGDYLYALRAVLGTMQAVRISDDAIGKATRVIAALKTYVRGNSDEVPVAVDIGRELSSLVELYYNKIKHRIELVLDIDPGAVAVGRREELNRIWFNLLDNAIHAVGERGRVEVRAKRLGGYIAVSVIDSGPGIPDDIKPRIFEPFFTTKAAGEGTGLGLDIARRLARANGGDISFTSRAGHTEFIVSVPGSAIA